MDPLAHTLIGASLAETGLKQKTGWATLTMMIAANLPDIDGLCLLAGPDAAFAGRRGITHGVVAALVLPVALALVIRAVAQRVARKKTANGRAVHAVTASPQAPLSLRWLIILSALGVWSHPLLDWMNSYGVRLLMPFSSRWFYGDALFIVDPFVWLFGAAALVFGYGKTRRAAVLWLLLLLAATAVLIVPNLTPPLSKMSWCIGAGLLVYVRIRGKPPSSRGAARVCLAVVAGYMVAMLAGTANARVRARAWLSDHALIADELVVVPMAARPFDREVIARVGGTYHFLAVRAFGEGTAQPTAPPLPVGERTPAVQAALAAPQAQGLVKWMRLAAFEEAPTADGTRVTISDVRYTRMGNTKLGRAQVWLDKQLRIIAVRP